MIQWLSAHSGDIIVIFVLAVIVGAIIGKMIRDKKKGKTACGCNCQGCSMCGSCHAEQK